MPEMTNSTTMVGDYDGIPERSQSTWRHMAVDLIVVTISLISLISFLLALLFIHIAMMYFISWQGNIRGGQQDLTTDPLPNR
ncbi:hypothetical protein SASPL_121894 [Salvia splendens]|uniref:Uncharacterized protein n=1 Tax=Salvia splendens TaxID=180675 RepID=A0A8X8ZRJ5_SALSN|nr:hypothetical protein SASPL_121894 [Salvia splendens]